MTAPSPTGCAPQGRAGRLAAAADALVSSAYGHAREAYSVEVFPEGVVMKRSGKADIKPPVGCVRGAIEGFSPEAARRLREFCVTQEAKGLVPWSTTLTVHRRVTPDEWRQFMQTFRMRLKRRGWAGVWRVELQRRKVPHVHVALWLPPEEMLGSVVVSWCESTGEMTDVDALKHAVKGRRIESSGWAVYLALHSGKEKSAQLGWKGKQWGVWNADAFTRREASPYSRELPVAQEVALRRFIGRLMRSKGSRARIGRAGFLRCMSGSVVERWLQG